MRQRVTYCMGGIPTSLEKRSEKTDRDRWTSRAREATVQGCSAQRWINASACPISGSLSAPSQPIRRSSLRSNHARIVWRTRISARRVITATLPGRSDRASAPSIVSVASSQACVPANSSRRRRRSRGKSSRSGCARGPANCIPPQMSNDRSPLPS